MRNSFHIFIGLLLLVASLEPINAKAGNLHSSGHHRYASGLAVSGGWQSKPSSSKQPVLEVHWQGLQDKVGEAAQDIHHRIAQQPRRRLIFHMIYWITAHDALHFILKNAFPEPASRHRSARTIVCSIFMKVAPRTLFSVGALLRGLQLCTPLHFLLDPSVGVGVGIHVCAALSKCQWVKPMLLGWTVSRRIWPWLGARHVDRDASVPVRFRLGS